MHTGRGVLSVSEICLVIVLVQNNIDTSHKIQLCTALIISVQKCRNQFGVPQMKSSSIIPSDLIILSR